MADTFLTLIQQQIEIMIYGFRDRRWAKSEICDIFNGQYFLS